MSKKLLLWYRRLPVSYLWSKTSLKLLIFLEINRSIFSEFIDYFLLETNSDLGTLYIYIAYDLCKSAGEQFEVHWINDVTWDDLILPVQTLRKHRVEQTLRSHSEVRYVAVGQRNGCIPIHQPGDVTTLRISYTSTSVLPQQSRRFLEDILANINDEDIQEAQFRSFVPWKNNGFMDLHEAGIDTTIIDIAGFDDAHRTILVETLTTLNICFFVPFKNKLFIPGYWTLH